ncbi:hypothetical protein ACFX14_029411 [Malus domestica]
MVGPPYQAQGSGVILREIDAEPNNPIRCSTPEQPLKNIFEELGLKKRSGKKEQLDSGLVNESWKKRWPNTKIIHSLVRASDHCSENWEEHHELISELTGLINRLKKMEEKYWKHRARIKWLQNGDSNTKFFHQTAIQRHKFNQIGKLLTVKRSGWRAWITFSM